MDAAISRQGPIRASEEELPQVAKGHQGNSNGI